MTATTAPAPAPDSPEEPHAPGQRRGSIVIAEPRRTRFRLPPGWPITFALAGFPIWWVLGLAGFILQLSAIPLLAGMIVQRRRLVLPSPLPLWFGFMGFALASSLMLEGSGRGLAFGWRYTSYTGALIWFLWIYNSDLTDLTRRIVNAIAIFWVGVILLGFASLVIPAFEITTPIEKIVPAGIIQNPFVNDLVHPRLAQTHDFLGFDLYRPAAPFPYTNNWGSAATICFPIYLLALQWAKPRVKLVGGLLGVAWIVPLLYSANRTAWATVVVGLLFAGYRLARRGRTRLFIVLVGGLLIGAAIIVSTPLMDLVVERVANPHSNEGRFYTYEQTLNKLKESPVLGFGGPRPNANPLHPPLGTQGMFWLVMFSHGIPAVITFLAFWFRATYRGMSARDDFGVWATTAVLVAVAQIGFYDLLPSMVFVVMTLFALLLRQVDRGYGADGWNSPGAFQHRFSQGGGR